MVDRATSNGHAGSVSGVMWLPVSTAVRVTMGALSSRSVRVAVAVMVRHVALFFGGRWSMPRIWLTAVGGVLLEGPRPWCEQCGLGWV